MTHNPLDQLGTRIKDTVQRQFRRALSKLGGKRVVVTNKHIVFNSHDFPRSLPRGASLFHDFVQYLPELEPQTIFDVGANVGQSAGKYVRHFPGSYIYCFEPASEAFSQLSSRLSEYPNVECVNVALGEESQHGTSLKHSNVRNRIVKGGEIESGSETEQIQIETVESFCVQQNINRIDFLKVDTEGYDLKVLKGAERLIDQMEIDAIQVEASMNSTNTYHVPLRAFQEYLEPKGYFLFAIYDQMHEWPTDEQVLRRSNPVFLSKRFIQKNHRS